MDQHTLIETLAINVLAALIGLSLPLIMQIIDRLDTKYGSAVISSAFRGETVYKIYYFLVWWTIALVIYLPWAPAPPEWLSDCWLVRESAHMLVSLSLALTLVFLWLVSQKIALYDRPERLLNYVAGPSDLSPDQEKKSDRMIEALHKDKEKFGIFGTLMKYSMTVGNIPLYLQCNTIFGFCIGSAIAKKPEGAKIVLPDSVYNLINETIRVSQRFYDELLYPSLNSPQLILSSYFNTYGKTVISEKSLNQLWQNLIQLISCNKPEWFKGYWVFASQYADYTVAERTRIPYDLDVYFNPAVSLSEDERKKFKEDNPKVSILESYIWEEKELCELHHLLLAYLIYIGKKDLVDWAFMYSPSSLNTQLLLPKNIFKIIYILESIERNFTTPIDFKYSFFQEYGIRAGETITDALLKFYIYSLYKQTENFNNGDSFRSPWDGSPVVDHNDPHSLHFIINLLDSLIRTVSSNKKYFESMGIADDIQRDIVRNIMELQENFRKRIKDLAESSEVNEDDFKHAEDLFNKACEEGKVLEGINTDPPVSKTKDDPVISHEICKEVGINISKDDYIWNTRSLFQDLTPTIISHMNFIAQKEYLWLFLLNSSRKNFYVNYDEIEEALQKLGVLEESRKYALLPVGVVPPLKVATYFKPQMTRGNRSEILILYRHNLPSVELDKRTKIFNKENKENKESKKIFFGGNICFNLMSNEKIDYIRLVIINSLIDGRSSQIDLIESIDHYL